MPTAKKSNVSLEDLSPSARKQAEKLISKTEDNRNTRRGKKKGRYTVSSKADRTVDGIVFDSRLEARFYAYLKNRVPKGELHLQPEFLLQEKCKTPDGKAIRSISYRGDFLLGPKREGVDTPLDNNRNVVIDAKGHLTDVFRIKAKMFVFRYRAKLWTAKNIKQLEAAIQHYEELRDA